MGRASTAMERDRKTFQDAINDEKFSNEQLKIMLKTASRLMGSSEIENVMKSISVDIEYLG